MPEYTGSSSGCGCCAGIDTETPRRISNPPGLPEISYRVGRHAYFKESLLARLSNSEYPALANLGTREDTDFSIALCDAWASVLDILSFYTERIANENYIRTARERRSVLDMARLIGYKLAPGVAASTHLAFTLQEAPGDPAQSAAAVTIPIGTKVQSVPGPDEKPQTFETVEEGSARVGWNAIPVQRSIPWEPVFDDRDLYLEGVETQLEAGDVILIVGGDREDNPENERWDIRALESVQRDTEHGRTRIAWADGIGHDSPHIEPAEVNVQVFVFRQRAALFGHNAPDPRLMSTTDEMPLSELVEGEGADLEWLNYEMDGEFIDLDTSYPKITADSWIALASGEQSKGSAALPGYLELYRAEMIFQVSRTDFGLSGKITRIKPDTTENLDPTTPFEIRETLVLAQSEALTTSVRPVLYPLYGGRLALDLRVEELEPGRALAFSGKRQRVVIASGVGDLKLTLDEGGEVELAEGDSLTLLAAAEELNGSTAEYLDPEDFGCRIGSADHRLRLQLMDRDGSSGVLEALGSELVLDSSRDDDEVVSEIANIATVTDERDRTELELENSLVQCFERATTTINANVVRATHGETVSEIVGSGDASRNDQSFHLRQSPLTHVSADTASGRASTLSLRANDLLWTQVPSLYGSTGEERAYTVSVNDDQVATVKFGDGVEGVRLPSGQNNVRAEYRKGLGVEGNVPANTITNLLSRPLGVNGAANVEAAAGGEDPEELDDARANAPLTVLTLDRAVSVKDYADFCRAFAGIAKAHALWLPAGPFRGVFITVAGIDGAAIIESSDTYGFLLDAIRAYSDPLVPVTVRSYRPVSFHADLAVKVASEYETEPVLAAVEDALREDFGFGHRSFGQAVTSGEIMAVTHGMDGVEAVKVKDLYRSDDSTFRSRLSAVLPVASLTDPPEAAELLTLDAGPLKLEELS